MPDRVDHSLEFLLAFDGFVYELEGSYWLKFEIARVEKSEERPHGLRYSLTLHHPNGRRIVGFDNAHPLRSRDDAVIRATADHWHRGRNDPGRPYQFVSAEKLIEDFFAEVGRALKENNASDRVVKMIVGRRQADENPKS